MQLSQRIRARDLEEFFSSVGKVRDVRLITCNKTRRFKGIAYIEFKDPESVALVSLFSDFSRHWFSYLRNYALIARFLGFGVVRTETFGDTNNRTTYASREEQNGEFYAQFDAKRNDRADAVVRWIVTF